MLSVWAYCDARFERATRQAAGVTPLTCPPATAATFDPSVLQGQELLYFDLHGDQGKDWWYGLINYGMVRERIPALYADQVRGLDLHGVTVFAATCHAGDPGNPMAQAFMDAGAVVIAGEGENYGPPGGKLYGAPLLGMWLRRSLERGWGVSKALTMARLIVRLSRRSVSDTVAFQLLGRNDGRFSS